MSAEFPVEWKAAAELTAHPQNFRRHPKGQAKATELSLHEFGWLENVVWNRRSGHVLSGHLRVSLAAAKGENVPVRVVDVDEETEKRILASLGRIGDLATVDDEALTNLLSELAAQSDDLPPGWSGKDLEKLIESTALEPEAEEGSDPDLDDGLPMEVPLSSVRMVQLFLTMETEPAFREMIQALARWHSTSTITDTVFNVVKEAYDEIMAVGGSEAPLAEEDHVERDPANV